MRVMESSHNANRTAQKKPISLTGQFAAGALDLQSVFEHIPGAIIFVNRQGHIEHMNQAATDLLGGPDGLLQLQQWSDKLGFYLADGIRPYPGEQMPPVRALQGETVEDQEMILRKPGEAEGLWVSMSSMPFDEPDGQLLGAVTLIRDISYRKQMERSREQNAQRKEALYQLSGLLAETGNDLDRITQGVASLTSQVIGDLSIVTLLEAKSQKLRVAAYEAPDPGRRAELHKAFLDTPDLDVSTSLAGAVVKSGQPILMPFILLDQRAELLMPALRNFAQTQGLQSLLIVPLLGRSGSLGAISLLTYEGHKSYDTEDQNFLLDIAYRTALAIENCRLFDSLREEITRRQAAKEALDLSEERFRAIFEKTAFGIKILDIDGNILQTNPSFQRMTGYDDSELVGRQFQDFLYPEDARRAAWLLHDLEANPTTAPRFEHRILHKDGSLVWLSTAFTRIKSGGAEKGPAFVVGILEDITARKRMELEMAELHKRLRIGHELERLRLAQELHDGPMQELYTAIYRLEELRGKPPSTLEQPLQEISEDIQAVVHALRGTASELRPPTLSAFGLEKAIRSHVEDFQEKYPKIKVELSLAHDKLLLPEDVRLALFRVAQQALSNVARHSHATNVSVRLTLDAEEVYLEITDNGDGFEMPSNLMKFLRAGHFGLAGATERVRALAGNLTVESQPGGGTTVRAVVPWGQAGE
jgi:PAS domain S-box-containing protein